MGSSAGGGIGALQTHLAAIDGLSAGAVAARGVAALAHEARDDAVEGASLIVHGFAGGARALLARAVRAEILARARANLQAESTAADLR